MLMELTRHEDSGRRGEVGKGMAPHKFLPTSALSPNTLRTTTTSSSFTVRFGMGCHYMDSYILHRSLLDDGEEGAVKRGEARGRRRSKETFPTDHGRR
jgi:hypothetical protein